jgi:Glycosyltransferase WbsX
VILNPEFEGGVYDLKAFVKEKTYLQDFDYTLYRTVLPAWDNTARNMSKAIIFNNSSPELYREWLDNVMEYTKKHYSKDNQFVYLHSWNEWAEAAHLEPDRKYGFAYLEATLDALEEARKKNNSE